MRKIKFIVAYFDQDYYEAGMSEKERGSFDTYEEAEEYILNQTGPYTPPELYIKKVYIRD